MDTLLSETGVQQAEAAGQYLKDIAFTKVFVSNLQRAVQVRHSGVLFGAPWEENDCDRGGTYLAVEMTSMKNSPTL